MEQVSPQLQLNFQCSRVNLSLISMLWLLEYVTCKIFWNIWIKLLGIQTWMTLGSNVLIGWTNPYTTSSSSAWKVPIKIDKWCKYGQIYKLISSLILNLFQFTVCFVIVFTVLSLQGSDNLSLQIIFLLTKKFFHVFCIFCKEPIY